jgi:hypothetical protein
MPFIGIPYYQAKKRNILASKTATPVTTSVVIGTACIVPTFVFV